MSEDNTARAPTAEVPLIVPREEQRQEKVTKTGPKTKKGKKPKDTRKGTGRKAGKKAETQPEQSSPATTQAAVDSPTSSVEPQSGASTTSTGKPTRPVGFLENSSTWAPEAVKGSPADKYLRSIQIVPREPKLDGNTNVHPAQAAERAVASARALGYAYSVGHRRVTAVYGSPRDERIVSYCNNKLAVADRMTLTRYSPPITPKDFSRQPTTITFGDAVRDAQCLYFVDIYLTDVGPSEPFSPNAIGRMLSCMREPIGGNKLIWVGRCFYGDSGTVCEEGGWYRKPDGKILFRSSVHEPAEYEHDPCDWIWKGSQAEIKVNGVAMSLTWSVLKVVGTFRMVVFNVSPAVCGLISDSEIYSYDDTFVKVRCPMDKLGWVGRFVLNRAHWVKAIYSRWQPLTVDRPLYKPLYLVGRSEALAKRITQTNYVRVVNALVQARMVANTQLFLRLFPQFDIKPNEYSAFAWGIIKDDLEERHVSLRVNRAFDGDRIAEVNTLQSEIGAPPSLPSVSVWPKVIAAASIFAVGAIAWVGLRRKFPMVRIPFSPVRGDWVIPSPLSYYLSTSTQVKTDNLLYGVVASNTIDNVVRPVVEEVVKAGLKMVHPTLGWLLPVAEWCEYHYALQSAGFSFAQILLCRLPPFIMHGFTQPLGIFKASLLHIAWNLVGAKLYQHLLAVTTGYHGISFPNHFVYQGRIRWWLIVPLLGALAWYLWPQRSLPKRLSHAEFFRIYYEEDWDGRALYDSTASFSEKFTDPRVPESTSPMALNEANLRGENYETNFIKVVGDVPIPEDKSTQFFYHLLPTNVPGYVPAANDYNLLVAIDQRLLKAPPLSPVDQRTSWRKLRSKWAEDLIFDAVEFPTIQEEWDELVDNWLLHFENSRQRNRYRNAVAQLRLEPYKATHPIKTPLFVKHDEVLMQMRDGKYTLKPRVIANVDPLFQATVGPYVYECQQRLKKAWSVDEKPMQVIDYKYGSIQPTAFHFVTGGGMSDVDLSRWMQKVLEYDYFSRDELGFAIMVCGDDSVVAISYFGKLMFIEADASMFDQSISFGPIEDALEVMLTLGLPEFLFDPLYHTHGTDYFFKSAKDDPHCFNYKLVLKERFIQATGIATTYLLNTIVMRNAWYYVIREAQQTYWSEFCETPMLVCRKLFGRLGFDMKMRVSEDYREVTFLKGTWYPCPNPYWGPLPSRFLKVGKSLKDPRTLYRVSDFETAGRMFLSDVANSYSVYLQVPILRAFVERYRASVPKPHSSARLNPYTTQAAGGLQHLILDSEAINSVCVRYNLTLADVERAEALIKNSDALTYLHDPVFTQLALVDYA